MPYGTFPEVLCVGQATLDHVFDVEVLHVGRKHVATSYRPVGGGVAANAAVAVSRLGGRARLLARLGDDDAGTAVARELLDEGVDLSLVERVPGVSTPTSGVIVDAAGGRTIANLTPPELFDDCVADLTGLRPDAVLVDGRWPAASDRALRLARALGVPGVVDVDRAPTPADLAILTGASHLVFSADALATLAGTTDPAAGLAAARVAVEGARDSAGPADLAGDDPVVAVTLGADGAAWLDAGEYRSSDAFEVDVVDSTGAGDVFHGAVALGLAEGADLTDAFRFAAAAAALKCIRPGARAGAPDRGAVDDLLEIGVMT